MKRIFMLAIGIFSININAAQSAVTDRGEIVILNDDGTWSHQDKSKDISSVPTNSQKFETPKGSSFLLKSQKNDSAFWLNASKWNFKKAQEGSATEYEFELKGKDLYAMAVTEEVSIPIDSLGEIALENAKEVAPDTRIIKKEYRTVNGQKVLHLEFAGTIQGINFTYIAYYYSDKSGSTQFLAYTGTNLVSKYRVDINDLLNGFTSQK